MRFFRGIVLAILVMGCQFSGNNKPEIYSEWEVIERYPSGIIKHEQLPLGADSSFQVRMYYESGAFSEKFTYKNGQLDGLAVRLFETGAPAKIAYFEDGDFVNLETTFYPSGKLRSRFRFENGVRVEGNFFYENGQPTGKLQFDSAGLISEGVYFYEDGSKRSSGQFEAGLREGQWMYFYRNGNIKEIGFFDKGSRTKTWFHYDSIGNLVDSTKYLYE